MAAPRIANPPDLRARRGHSRRGSGQDPGALQTAQPPSPVEGRLGFARQARTCIQMANVAVIGAQWGDEGKGKIVDWLAERADVVVRFQGGHNAGHTLVIGNVEYRLSLLPSGVVRPDKLSIIGTGVVIDPWALVKEIEAMRE